MAFKHLEDSLVEGSSENLGKWLDFHSKLHEPTRTVFGYALDIAAYLSSVNLSNEYAIFGGYAVLSHIMQEHGDDVAVGWRGSSDVDMGGSARVLQAIKSGYQIKSCLQSPNIPDKATVKLTEEGEEECRIDFYCGDFNARYGQSVNNTHFGVKMNVINPLYIISGKILTPVDESQHIEDILAMLNVLERREVTPKDIVGGLGHAYLSGFSDRLGIGKDQMKTRRFGFTPSPKFLNGLLREAHKRRNIPHPSSDGGNLDSSAFIS